MNFVVFKQPAGFGDIFYLQKAAQKYLDENKIVIWPVNSDFIYLREYIKKPNLVFVDKEQDFPLKELYNNEGIITPQKIQQNNFILEYIPFQHSQMVKHNETMMKTKYMLIDYDDDNWQDYFKFQRNIKQEQDLKQKYNIKDGEDFIFISDSFASPPDIIKRPINVNTNKKIIYNTGSKHIFDYCWLFENASEIHVVESAFCYIIENLNTKGKLFMYSRKIGNYNQHNSWKYIQGIHNRKPWIKIYD